MNHKFFFSLSFALAAAFLFIGSQAKAEFFSISAGIPILHSFSDSKTKSEGVSGFFLHGKLPILVGAGYESYKTKIKSDGSQMELGTTMYDVFYLLPIPIINLTVGLGAGQTELICNSCSSSYDRGTAMQWYASLGYPFLGIMDVHLSYRSVTSTIKGKSNNKDVDASGTVTGIGASIGF